MSESIQVTSSAGSAAPKTKLSSIESGQSQASSDDTEGFTAVFTSYVETEPDATKQKLSDEINALLNQLMPEEMLSDGNTLPEEGKAAIWQALLLMQPAESISSQSTSALQFKELGNTSSQSKPVMNMNLLSQDYFQTLAQQNKDGANSILQGLPVNTISTQLSAAHFNPATNEALILNLNDQLIPVNAVNTSNTGALAAVGLGTATQAAITQTQSAPLNMGQHSWEANLGARLQMLVGQNVQTAEIRLDPPELGSLDIKIKVSNDIASVNITSPNAQVREALETTIPKLREMFEESGLSLGDVNVRQESFAQQHNSDNESGELTSNNSNTDQDDESMSESRAIITNSLLDIYA